METVKRLVVARSWGQGVGGGNGVNKWNAGDFQVSENTL